MESMLFGYILLDDDEKEEHRAAYEFEKSLWTDEDWEWDNGDDGEEY